MNIHKKIEEIRQKPEHVRMQYVFLYVGISMFILFIFWIFSFKSALNESFSGNAGSTCSNDNGTCQTPSKETLEKSLDPMKSMSGFNNTENTQEKSINDLVVPE